MSKAMSWMMLLVTMTVLGLIGSRALAGQTDAPGAPTDAASAMWTLNDLYNVLDTRTTNVTLRTTAFREPTSGPGGTMRTLNEIMGLATNRAPVQKTGQTTSYAMYDDAWYSDKVGVAWPVPRFTAGTSGAATNCVTDRLTGLMWAKDVNLAKSSLWSTDGKVTWDAAMDMVTNSVGPVNGAAYGGYTDWRIPNVRELLTLAPLGGSKIIDKAPFANYPTDPYYWTSTASASGANFRIRMNNGEIGGSARTSTLYLIPVRGGGQ